MTDPDSGETVVDEWWLGYGLVYEAGAPFAPTITAFRCTGTLGCGGLVMDVDFDRHAQWHVRLKGR